MSLCCVIGCPRPDDHNLTYHKFPPDPNICNAWIKCTGRENWKPNDDSRVCSIHFNERQIRNLQLHPMAVPTLFVNTTAMEEEEWPLQRLETFASVYVHHEVLYVNPPPATRTNTTEQVHQNDQSDRELALERLARALGLDNDQFMSERCREFRYQMLCYVRARVRSCALRDEHYGAALRHSPAHVARLASRLDLLHVAALAELACAEGPLPRWTLRTVLRELTRAARLHCRAPDRNPQGLTSHALALASAAVVKGARPVPSDLWLSVCALRKKQLLKLSLAGDRSEVLCPAERLQPDDWHLVDVLLLHSPDDDMPVITEVSLHWRESLRALVLLAEALAAARRARCTRVWHVVHARYVDTGRSASLVLLQRRWQQLQQLARRTPPPRHPLLALVAESARGATRASDTPRHGLVRAGDHEAYEVTLDIDFSKLEECKTTKEIMLYIENKILEHKTYFDSALRNRHELAVADVDTVEEDCIEVEYNTELPSHVVEDEAADTIITIDSDSELSDEVRDTEKKKDENTDMVKESNKKSVEVEINTSRIVDYMSDVLMEVESLRTLDDIERTVHDIDRLETFKVKKLFKDSSEPVASAGRHVDGDGVSRRIQISKSGKMIFGPTCGTLDPKLLSVPQVKLKRIDETNARRRLCRYSKIDNKRSDTVETKRSDSVETKSSDTVDTKHSDTVETKRSDKVETKRSDTVETKRSDTVETKRSDTVETKRSDTVETKRSDTFETNNNDHSYHLPLQKNSTRDNEADITYISDSGTESEHEFLTEHMHDKTSRNPDLNPKLKRLLKGFWRNPTNGRLLAMCKPAVVRLSRLPEELLPRTGRVVKRVELADIEEVRRINKNILTAQVGPTYVQNSSSKPGSDRSDELERRARALAGAALADDLERLENELVQLFAVPPEQLQDMINAAIYDCVSDEDPAQRMDYNGRYARWLKRRERGERGDTPTAPADTEYEQQKIIKNKYFEIGTRKIDTNTKSDAKVDDDLDDVLTCTIIRKPTAGDALPALPAKEPCIGDTRSTPVITGVCSLAKNSRVPKSVLPDKSPQLAALHEAVRRIAPRGSSDGHEGAGGSRSLVETMGSDGGVTLVPNHKAVRTTPIRRRNTAGSRKPPKHTLPKQYAKFNDANNDFASLTPVIIKDAHTSTITLVPTTHTQTFTTALVDTLAAPQQLALITNPLTNEIIPTLVTSQLPAAGLLVPTLVTSQGTAAPGQLVGALAMTSQMAPQLVPAFTVTSPLTGLCASQLLPAFTLTTQPQLVVTSQVLPAHAPAAPGLLPMMDHTKVGVNDNADGALALDGKKDTAKWMELGRVAPPSALTFNRPLSPKDYIAHFGSALTVVKLDSSKPLWTVAAEYLILAEKILPCKNPSFWALGAPDKCTQLIWPQGFGRNVSSNKILVQDNTSGIVIENVVGNYRSEAARDDVTLVTDSDEDAAARPARATLKVRSFARCARSERNVLQPAAAGLPDVVEERDQYYKKLTDEPPVYSLMLSVVSSTEECDGLLRERAALHVWDRLTGDLTPLEVSGANLEQVPSRMNGALLLRHGDSRFLKDMAFKFQELNSANALVRENQVYVFAPKSGSLLVAPPDTA